MRRWLRLPGIRYGALVLGCAAFSFSTRVPSVSVQLQQLGLPSGPPSPPSRPVQLAGAALLMVGIATGAFLCILLRGLRRKRDSGLVPPKTPGEECADWWVFLSFFLLAVVASRVLVSELPARWSPWVPWACSACGMLMGFLPLAIRRGFRRARYALGLYLGRQPLTEVLLGLLAFLSSELVWGGTVVFSGEMPVSLVQVPGFGGVVAVAVVAPVTEEIAYRGALHRAARRPFGPALSTMIVAAAFALGHPFRLFQSWFILVGGVYLSILREHRGSLMACVTMHAAGNAFHMVWPTVLDG